MSPRFDWAGLMRAGIQGLGLEPARFWQLTPVELRLLLGLEPGEAPMSRARLAELTAVFPDRRRGESDERREPDEARGAGGQADEHGGSPRGI